MYTRIIVPLDGSDLARQALPEAEHLARLTGAPLHLLRVVDVTRMPWYGQYGQALEYGAMQSALDDEAEAALAGLNAIAEKLSASGLKADSEIRRGLAAREIAAAAAPGDVIVMASHGRGGFSRWLLGSVAETVLRQANVPVLLIRARATSSDGDVLAEVASDVRPLAASPA